jgi:hypothetical protein
MDRAEAFGKIKPWQHKNKNISIIVEYTLAIPIIAVPNKITATVL